MMNGDRNRTRAAAARGWTRINLLGRSAWERCVIPRAITTAHCEQRTLPPFAPKAGREEWGTRSLLRLTIGRLLTSSLCLFADRLVGFLADL